MYLKAHRRNKDGKAHVYYSLSESVRLSRTRVVQRTVLHLGELNTTQQESWQRTIAVIEEDGREQQLRLFTDREGQVPEADDVVEVRLSSLAVRRPRVFGSCWVGCKLWEALGLRAFWEQALGEDRGAVSWAKVLELLVINRLCAPRSELSIHEKWFGQTAMDFLLDCDAQVAEKDRLYRCLDRVLPHKAALEKHLAGRWRDLFGVRVDVLLYDLTSTYFEGEAEGVEQARRGYSRDHRPDCRQVVLALVVTPEGFPLAYEVFAGNRQDSTTLEAIMEAMESKYGRAQRVWVFDRGVVSEANLARLRACGGRYLVGTPRSHLRTHERRLLSGEWSQVTDAVQVQLIPEGGETYVLARSTTRAQKERAMRVRRVRGLMRDLIRLRKAVRHGGVAPAVLRHRLGRLHERHPQAWRYVLINDGGSGLRWRWDRAKLQAAAVRDGAYLLRTNLTETDPAVLWRQYTQLTEVEAAFRALKSDLAIRPIWHWTTERIEAHLLVAFLSYCLWVCLKQQLRAGAPALTPWQCLDQFQRILFVEVWFHLRDGRALCLPRITQPDPTQALLLDQLGWRLPEQPPPRIYAQQVPDVWPT